MSTTDRAHPVTGQWPSQSIEPTTPRVVVSVGTDHHPFDRVVGWIDRWALEHPDTSVVVQRGTSERPKHVESHDLIGHAELLRYFANADVVVSHGGPSTVMDARMAGRLPIVVPRDPELGEHIDGHQLRFADHLARHGLARLTKTEEAFVAALDEALADPAAFTIRREQVLAPPGVVQFGATVDRLLGITTPIDTVDVELDLR